MALPDLSETRSSQAGLHFLEFPVAHQKRPSLNTGHEKPGQAESGVNERLSDVICEQAGRRIYEAQQSRLGDQTCLAAKRRWRSPDVPRAFWDGYCADARAALSIGESESEAPYWKNANVDVSCEAVLMKKFSTNCR